MNNARRKKVAECLAELKDIYQGLTESRNAENTDYEALDDDTKYDDKGNNMEITVGFLDDALDNIESAIEELSNPLFVSEKNEGTSKNRKSSTPLEKIRKVIPIFFDK